MFNLEINFLKDRRLMDGDPKSTFSKRPKGEGFKIGEQVPLFIGLGVTIFGMAVAGGLSWYFNGEVAQSQSNIQKLDQQLSTFKSSKDELNTVQQKLAKIKEETKAIVNVFGKVQSVSAIIQDLGDQMPRGVTVKSISEVEVAASPETDGVPGTKIELVGLSKDYEGVNDFLLTLQKSPFLNPEKTQIEKAQEIDTDFEFFKPKDLPSFVSWKQEQTTLTVTTPKEVIIVSVPPKEISFTMTTQLNGISAEKLVQELQQKGANGLVTRLKTLKEKGLIEP